MIFDRAQSDHVSVDHCVLLAPCLLRVAAGRPRLPAEAVNRKDVRSRLLAYPSGYIPARLPVRRHLRFYVLLIFSKSNLRTVPIGVEGVEPGRSSLLSEVILLDLAISKRLH